MHSSSHMEIVDVRVVRVSWTHTSTMPVLSFSCTLRFLRVFPCFLSRLLMVPQGPSTFVTTARELLDFWISHLDYTS